MTVILQKENQLIMNDELLRKRQIEAAAKTWVEWQFESVKWEDLEEKTKKKFREAAKKILDSAMNIPTI